MLNREFEFDLRLMAQEAVGRIRRSVPFDFFPTQEHRALRVFEKLASEQGLDRIRYWTHAKPFTSGVSFDYLPLGRFYYQEGLGAIYILVGFANGVRIPGDLTVFSAFHELAHYHQVRSGTGVEGMSREIAANRYASKMLRRLLGKYRDPSVYPLDIKLSAPRDSMVEV